MCGAAVVQAHAAMVGGHCVITCRQLRLPGCSAFGKAKASGRVDVYTQGQQGSGCQNNARIDGLFLVWMPRGCGHRWLRERDVLRHSAQLRRSCSQLCACLSAAASALMQKQAAARMAIPWVLRPHQGEGVRTGARLHPGLAGERLLEQRPKLCFCFCGRPRGCGALL